MGIRWFQTLDELPGDNSDSFASDEQDMDFIETSAKDGTNID